MRDEYEKFIAQNIRAYKEGQINGQKARDNLLKIIPIIDNGDKRYIKNKIFSYNNLFK
jgi:hypothetical protein